MRKRPVLLDTIPRLLARLPVTHPKVNLLEDILFRINAGYYGESNVDIFIKRADLNPQTHIFTNVHLKVSPSFTFEIDTLIISNRYVLVVEVKNLKGIVRFVSNPPHLIRELENGEETAMDCPVCQTEMNKANLDKWFRQQGIHLKTTGLLVLANQKNIIKDVPPNFPVVYRKQIPHYLNNLKPAHIILSPDQIHHISRQIQLDQLEYNPLPLCSYYKIDPLELRRGLLCRHCHGELIRNTRETWHCSNCKKDAEDPYNDAISDWFTLVKNSITNEECRDFLKLKNKRISYHFLKKSSLIRKGKSVATFYTR